MARAMHAGWLGSFAALARATGATYPAASDEILRPSFQL
jgi:hypothetical protein